MELHVVIDGDRDLAGQLYRQLRDSIRAGRLGNLEIAGDNILLGKPFTFTKENIDQFDF